MSSRRTLILIGAVVVGALAAFVLLNYISSIEDDVNRGAELVETVQAKGPVPRGTRAEDAAAQGLLGTEPIQQKFKPANAVDDVANITGRVAVFDIAQNTVILDNMFVDSSLAVSRFRDQIRNPEYATVTISLSEAQAVAGNLRPGDFVNIMMLCGSICEAAAAEGQTENFLPVDETNSFGFRYLYQNAHILAIGQTAALGVGEQVEEEDGAAAPEQDQNRGLITFDMPVEAVQLLATIDIRTQFSLYLSLVPREYEPEVIPPMELSRLDTLPGEVGSELTPYGVDGWQEQ